MLEICVGQFTHYYQSRQLAYSTATKFLLRCVPLASLLMVLQLWFMFFILCGTMQTLKYKLCNIENLV